MTNGSGPTRRRNFRAGPHRRAWPWRHRTRRQSSSSRRGAAAVEFALVAPLIFLFLFAIIEFGRGLMVVHALESAAREGCRVAVRWDGTLAEVQTTVDARLQTFGVSSHTITIDPNPPTNACQWEPITLTISVSYDNVGWLPLSGILDGITLTGSCTMPQESNQCSS